MEATLAETANPVWEVAVAATTLGGTRSPNAPLLAGARIPVDRGHVDRWGQRLLTIAGEAGPDAVSLLGAAKNKRLDAVAFLEAALNCDGDRLAAIAQDLGLDPDALGAIAPLAAMPLLQALRRRFAAAADPRWSEGICPVCGGWPALAEQRGLERARRLRCGRCGGDWAQSGARCPFCDAVGHERRAALVSEHDRESRCVETCAVCHSYLKTVSTLRAWADDEVILADLATIDLDFVAVERDYARPEAKLLTPGARLTG